MKSPVLCLRYISRLLNLNNSLRSLDIKLTFRQTNTLRSNLVRTSPATDTSGVYSISCSSYLLQYFGETGRSLSDRLKEHKGSVKLDDTNSVLFYHIRDNSHPINWSSAKIVFPSSSFHRRRLIEASFIHNSPQMNLKPGFVSVDVFLSHYIVKCSEVQNTYDLT